MEPASVLVNPSGQVSQVVVFGAAVKVPAKHGVHCVPSPA